MTHRYEVDEQLVVRIWSDESEDPFIIQPTSPAGDYWVDSDAASSWAESYIELLNPTIVEPEPYVPDESPVEEPPVEEVPVEEAPVA